MKTIIFIILMSLSFGIVKAQNIVEIKKAKQILLQRDEICIEFQVKNRQEINELTKQMSIDFVEKNKVRAYLNTEEFDNFLKLAYSFSVYTEKNKNTKVITMATTVEQMANWDRYPTYEVYIQMMNDFATNYPSICKLETIGTSVNGRQLLALKISDNVNEDEDEPEFFYTSTMHGDETTGAILLLRLADEILSNYGIVTKNTQNSNDIVDNFELYINPFANPDGTYYGGNSTVSGARRYNGNSIDINRNFPDPKGGNNPDGLLTQKDTQAFIDYANSHHFVMSANFHGGSEVVNYPWDTWYDYQHQHPDEDWYIQVSRDYANSAQNNSPSGYMTDLDNGITNGADWYSIEGGRQDYMNFFQHCREVTIELSSTKLVSSTELNNYWNYNKESLYNYIKEANYGIHGLVTDISGNPIKAKVEVLNHDKDNSFVYSSATVGDYHRPIEAGTYDLLFSAEGYISKTINNVEAIQDEKTILNVMLDIKTGIDVTQNKFTKIYPNPVNDILNIEFTETINSKIKIEIYDVSLKLIKSLSLKNNKNTTLNLSNLESGSYFCKISYKSKSETLQFIKE